jgi:hypothetical protein
MKLTVILFSILLSSTVNAATLTILTDQKGSAKAKELKELITKTPPFSRIRNLDINIVEESSIECEKMQGMSENNSGSSESSANSSLPASCKVTSAKKSKNSDEEDVGNRLVSYDCTSLAKVQSQTNADYLILVKNDSQYGGSGGTYPTMTTGSPAQVGLHELLHQMGFADEYSYYSACEADIYCDASMGRSVNVAIFADKPPYSSDAQARGMHSKQIPWYGKIKPATEIITGSQLGTPKNGLVGVYHGQTCELATNGAKGWVSGSEENLMESVYTNLIPEEHWQAISEALNEPIEASAINSEEACTEYPDKNGKIQKYCKSDLNAKSSSSKKAKGTR